ncbi:MAG: OsmC family protein [Chloroflexi bacterium]|nr:OsmC family protein [Chloroflexota bacterium]MCI0576955.1 OsmC family protein [Chloroflexota bacterium]MCI0645553.1 OsmC family protein [Chloroflexota bacterium]MCI0730948.1 OsmC family protein [Chloroflexota bacterium]
MEATVHWHHGLSFTGAANSGFTADLGASPSVGGDNDGMRPMEMILIGLAGCTAMDVISILRKKRQDVTGFEVKAYAVTAPEHPKVFTDITIHYIVRGHNVDPQAVERSIELSETKYCPAQAMLIKAVPIRLTYEIIEE